ncbi:MULTISPECIES: MGMT family protein [Nocardioides]|uniref:MGMT family protein n=1 Tax=Nocardioides TaxID=1839 RepID=UPI00032D979D|nr:MULTISPECIES: MGMT family protein [Nocardioides]EON23415.1 methylated-DNA--protein-cysteine [Nocardioides sp. CF8]
MSSINPEDVFAAVRAIPVGAVITYGDLAERVGLTRNHARAVGNVLGSRPDNDAWMTTPAENHDIPWWRVVKADGTLLADQDDDSRRWVEWAKSVLVSEGVAFTADGRVASLATAHRRPSGSGTRTSQAKPHREPEPCWRHETIQYSCRDCAPSH